MSGVPAKVLDFSMCVVGFGVSDEHFIYSTFHDLPRHCQKHKRFIVFVALIGA